MSMDMRAALKKQIMRRREKEKQEKEADAATQRVRLEREMKHRQDAMKLAEILNQVQQAERQLASLKEERLQLSMQLEKVLREEDARKRARVKEANN
ncbi:hypothetical protein HPB49_016576 [Dermacentor silvarum]|uniref:Uncharacterized protein n=1 Tax=Dermacentor silvarum TaxID=543639 RepID=A0ACB8CA59_DERSI|nr:hypothetical protein HPB49_016576 [Dermacentor silvarum]